MLIIENYNYDLNMNYIIVINVLNTILRNLKQDNII